MRSSPTTCAARACAATWRGRAAGARAPAKVIVAGWSASTASRLRAFRRSPTQWAPADGRHGSLRRAGRRRRASRTRCRMPTYHDHHPQDALRPAQRHDPVHGGARQGHRPFRVPRPAGRAPVHVIAAKAVALGIARLSPSARQHQRMIIARAFADELIAGGSPVLTGGTDVPPGAGRSRRLRLFNYVRIAQVAEAKLLGARVIATGGD